MYSLHELVAATKVGMTGGVTSKRYCESLGSRSALRYAALFALSVERAALNTSDIARYQRSDPFIPPYAVQNALGHLHSTCLFFRLRLKVRTPMKR